MNVKVSINVTERDGYQSTDIAVASLEINAPWDDTKPAAVQRALTDAIEDITERATAQLRADVKRRLEIRAEAEAGL